MPDSRETLSGSACRLCARSFVRAGTELLDEVEQGLEQPLRSSSINVQHQMIAQAGIALPDFIGEPDPLLCRVLPDMVVKLSAHSGSLPMPNWLGAYRGGFSWLSECRHIAHI